MPIAKALSGVFHSICFLFNHFLSYYYGRKREKKYSFLILVFLPFIYSLKYQSKNTQLHIAGCKIGYCLCKLLIFNFVAVRTGQ